ncbi:MAG: hypothetical protein KDA32_12835 [Phycisphaerales bacterium]|nr:hypothetical protein [Phycisphaerales bacterium]
MQVESGPATGDRNYYAILTLFFAAFLVWFVKDGVVGWPSKNITEARKLLVQYPIPDSVVAALETDEVPVKPDFEGAKKAKLGTVREVRERLGQPDKSVEADGLATDYYVSKYGLGTVQSRAGAVTVIDWQTWYKTKEEINAQFTFAGICGVIMLLPLYRLVRAMMVRATVDDNGLTYCGNPIPFSEMTSLRDYNKKGWVDLYYDRDGAERKLRLDNVKVAKFDEIIDALCQAKGYADPRKVRAAEEPAEA